jgi:hypothetical protein
MKFNLTLFLLLFLCSCASNEKKEPNSENNYNSILFRIDTGGASMR